MYVGRSPDCCPVNMIDSILGNRCIGNAVSEGWNWGVGTYLEV